MRSLWLFLSPPLNICKWFSRILMIGSFSKENIKMLNFIPVILLWIRLMENILSSVFDTIFIMFMVWCHVSQLSSSEFCITQTADSSLQAGWYCILTGVMILKVNMDHRRPPPPPPAPGLITVKYLEWFCPHLLNSILQCKVIFFLPPASLNTQFIFSKHVESVILLWKYF